jgi:DNA-directed RNA polymerase sigma subunit (sigma70/sigma32)
MAITSKEKWQTIKADPIKYAAIKKQVVECRRNKRQEEQAISYQTRRQVFLDSIGGNWDAVKYSISPLHREILELYFGLNEDSYLTLTEIGLKLGKSKQAISGLKDRAIKFLLSAGISD